MHIFILSILCLINGCPFEKESDNLVLEFYSEDNILLYELWESEIVCFDWAHQSVLVSEKAKKNLSNNLNLLKGKMFVKLKGLVLYEASIISDDINYEYGMPKVIFKDEGLFFFYENWFLIRYLKNRYEKKEDEPVYFEELLNEDLFNYLREKGKLNCIDWNVVKEDSKISNDVDLNPQKTAQEVLPRN